MAATRKNFTKECLLKLKPGEVISDAGYGGYGAGTLLARAAKNGDVTITLKVCVDGKQLKREIAKGMVGYFASGGSLSKLRQRAYEIAEEAKLRTHRPGHARQNAPTTIGDLGDAYLAYRAENDPYADAGKQAKVALNRATAFWGNLPVTELNKSEGSAFLDHVIDDARKASGKRDKRGDVGGRVAGRHPGHEAAKSARSFVKMVLTHAATEYGLDVRTDIFDGKKLKNNPPKEGAMSTEECDRFHQALRDFVEGRGGKQGTKHKRTGRHRAVAVETASMIELCYLAAGRMKEWKQARWGEIDLEAETPTWTIYEDDRKQRTKHVQVLTPDAVNILKAVKERRTARWGRPPRKQDYVFPGIRAKTPDEAHRVSYDAAFNTILDMSGVNEGRSYDDKITPHRAVRASRITELRDVEGWTAREVADYVGATEQVIESVYYKSQVKLERQAAKVSALKSRRAVV